MSPKEFAPKSSLIYNRKLINVKKLKNIKPYIINRLYFTGNIYIKIN